LFFAFLSVSPYDSELCEFQPNAVLMYKIVSNLYKPFMLVETESPWEMMVLVALPMLSLAVKNRLNPLHLAG